MRRRTREEIQQVTAKPVFWLSVRDLECCKMCGPQASPRLPILAPAPLSPPCDASPVEKVF